MRFLLLLAPVALFAQYDASPVGGSITYTTGAHGQGAQGTNTSAVYASIPSGAVNFAGDFSVSAKVNVSTVDGFRDFFSSSTLTMGYYWGGVVRCIIAGTNVDSSGIDITGFSFPEVSCRRSGSTGSVWVNGVQRGSATVGTGNLGTATAQMISAGTSSLPTSAVLDELSIWTTSTPTACNPCTGSESGLRALYHLNGNLLDSAGASSGPSATIAAAVNLALNITCSNSPCSVQIQSYTGACASGTFANDGAAVTGVTTGLSYYSRNDATVKCYRAIITDAGSASVTTSGITAPGSGGGMRSY